MRHQWCTSHALSNLLKMNLVKKPPDFLDCARYFSSWSVALYALVYFSIPLDFLKVLWQYFKIILFQIINKTNLTLPYLTNLTSPALTLPGGHQRSPSKALKLLFFEVLGCDAR
jgi:hypothetical protein